MKKDNFFAKYGLYFLISIFKQFSKDLWQIVNKDGDKIFSTEEFPQVLHSVVHLYL